MNSTPFVSTAVLCHLRWLLLKDSGKDTSRPIADVRREVLKRKKQPPFSQAVIRLNPKIDKSRRRLQCSISCVRHFKNLAPGRDRKAQPFAEIFGRRIPSVPASPPREL